MPLRVLIVTPTYNERENLPTFLEQVFSVAPDAHVLVVDDHSPDGTGELADQIGALRPARDGDVHRPGKMGSSAART